MYNSEAYLPKSHLGIDTTLNFFCYILLKGTWYGLDEYREKFGKNACVQGCGAIGTCTLKMFCFGGGGDELMVAGDELMVAARGNFL
ncbi:hypothetical protein OIU85_015311, partial [Salix viminalis]